MPTPPFQLVMPSSFDPATVTVESPLDLGSGRFLVRKAETSPIVARGAGDYKAADVTAFVDVTVAAATFAATRVAAAAVTHTNTSSTAPETGTVTLDLDGDDLVVLLVGSVQSTGSASPFYDLQLNFGSGLEAADEVVYSSTPARQRVVRALRWNNRTAATVSYSLDPLDTAARAGSHLQFVKGKDFDVVTQIIGTGSNGTNITGGVSGSLNVLEGDVLLAAVSGADYNNSGVTWTGLTPVVTALNGGTGYHSIAEDPDVAADASPRAITFAMNTDTDVRYEGVVLRFTPAA